MLFQSFYFLAAFLPATLALVAMAMRRGSDAARVVLILLSLVFYASWIPEHTPLLALSILVNWQIREHIDREGARHTARQALGVVLNLAALAWFKYRGFAVDILIDLGAVAPSAHIDMPPVPLALSFFTFQQIGYLLIPPRRDGCGEGDRRTRFRDYALFIAFFPQLVIGPIVRWQEFQPQTKLKRFLAFRRTDLAVGAAIFALGLGKKVFLADPILGMIDPIYAAAERGETIGFVQGWIACFGFITGLALDFSGYSDMATGLARLFGIVLPVNFMSPFRATTMAEFWRRWHMTLTRFFAGHLHKPIATWVARVLGTDARRSTGGSWRVLAADLVPLVPTFLLIGIWHGANWTFVLFGALHVGFVSVNRLLAGRGYGTRRPPAGWPRMWRQVLTFTCLAASSGAFRAESMRSVEALALAIWPGGPLLAGPLPDGPHIAGLVAICIGGFFLPNTAELFRRYRPFILDPRIPLYRSPIEFRLTLPWAMLAGALLGAGILLSLGRSAPFVYFVF